MKILMVELLRIRYKLFCFELLSITGERISGKREKKICRKMEVTLLKIKDRKAKNGGMGNGS